MYNTGMGNEYWDRPYDPDMRVESSVSGIPMVANPTGKARSVWELEAFDDVRDFDAYGKKFEIKPKELKACFEEYGSTAKSIIKILKERGCGYDVLSTLMNRFPDVRNAYEAAKRQKVEALGENVLGMVEAELPEQYWEYDKNGNKKPSSGGVRWMEKRIEYMLRMAAVYETGSFVESKRVDSRNMNVNVDVTNKDTIEAIMNRDVSKMAVFND